MAKKKRMIDIDDLLEDEQLTNENNDMVFVTATEEPPVTPIEKRGQTRLERIRSSAVDVEEPLFDGETDLDLGQITLNSEMDAQQIEFKRQQAEITKKSNQNRDDIVDDMQGQEPDDVVSEFGLDVNAVPMEQVDRKAMKRADSKAVQEILESLHRK